MKEVIFMTASELLLRRVAAARNAATLQFREDDMSKNYSRIDIDSPGRLSAADFPLATIAAVGAIIALTAFLLAFLLVSI
jgi:hypothetical protein